MVAPDQVIRHGLIALCGKELLDGVSIDTAENSFILSGRARIHREIGDGGGGRGTQ